MSDDQIRTVLAALGALQVGQARLEEKVDRINADNDRGDRIHDDHEARLRRLEKWMFILTGIAAAGGSAVGSVAPRFLG